MRPLPVVLRRSDFSAQLTIDSRIIDVSKNPDLLSVLPNSNLSSFQLQISLFSNRSNELYIRIQKTYISGS